MNSRSNSGVSRAVGRDDLLFCLTVFSPYYRIADKNLQQTKRSIVCSQTRGWSVACTHWTLTGHTQVTGRSVDCTHAQTKYNNKVRLVPPTTLTVSLTVDRLLILPQHRTHTQQSDGSSRNGEARGSSVGNSWLVGWDTRYMALRADGLPVGAAGVGVHV